MNCSEIKFFTPLYLSSELDATPMFDFELHLRRCAACTRELEDARRCDDLLREALHQEALDTVELRRRIKNKLFKTERRRFLFRRPFYTLPIAASLLVVIIVGTFTVLRDSSSQTVYAAARDDHYTEVVQHDPRPWLETPEEIREFVRAELGDADFLDRFAPAGYQLKRALHCILSDQRYVHLVYQSGDREISIYVRRKDGELPGATVETVNGCALHAAAINRYEIAGFQSPQYTVLVVSDLPRTESLRIARDAALGLT